MKDNQVINFIEPSKRSPKESNKRKKSIYEISTRCTAKKLNNCQSKNKQSCGFCNIPNHTITSCPTKCGIGSIIDGDVLVEYLQNICTFKVIDSDLCENVFYEPLNCCKVQHLKCHQLLSKIIPCINQRPDDGNLLVKVTCYEKHGKPIVGFIRVIFQLPLSISFIHSKKIQKQQNYSPL